MISDDITYSTICRNVFILYNIGSYQLSLKYLTNQFLAQFRELAIRKANTTSVNKHEPSYEQLEVKTNRLSFYAKSQRTLQHRIVRYLYRTFNIET
jgi:hypothetical protein